MTVVVFKDGIMAADSGIFAGDIVSTINFKKIHVLKTKKRKEYIVGVAGSVALINKLLNNLKYDTYESIGDEISAMVYDVKEKKLYMSEGGSELVEVVDEFYAIGSGYEIAYGALEMGASAEETVQICIKRHTYCAGEPYMYDCENNCEIVIDNEE